MDCWIWSILYPRKTDLLWVIEWLYDSESPCSLGPRYDFLLIHFNIPFLPPSIFKPHPSPPFHYHAFPCTLSCSIVLVELIPRIGARSFSIASSSAYQASSLGYFSHTPDSSSSSIPTFSHFSPIGPIPLCTPYQAPQSLDLPLLDLSKHVDEAFASAYLRDSSTSPSFGSAAFNSPTFLPSSIHLCVAVVTYRTPYKRWKHGLLSSYLASLSPSPSTPSSSTCTKYAYLLQPDRVWMNVRKGSFVMPSPNTPLVR